MKQKNKKNGKPHDFSYWLKRLLISLPLLAFTMYLLGEYHGNAISFLRDVLEFSIIITVLLAISDKIWKKWGNKNFLFRKVF